MWVVPRIELTVSSQAFAYAKDLGLFDFQVFREDKARLIYKRLRESDQGGETMEDGWWWQRVRDRKQQGEKEMKHRMTNAEKKRLQRTKSAGLAMAMVLSMGILAGCSGSRAAAEEADGQYTVGILQFGEHGSLDNCREGFLEGLAEEGILEGENLTVIYENAQFDPGLNNQIADSFVAKGVDLIGAVATPSAQSAFNAARGSDIPVVYTAVENPEAAMLTEGSITGTSDRLPVEAQLKLIRAMLPEAERIGILYTTSEVNSLSTLETYQALAGDYGFAIEALGVSVAADIPLALDRILGRVDAMTNLTDNTVVGSLPLVLARADARGIPVFGSEIEQVRMGAMASEGIEYVELGRASGRMAARILKGEEAAGIPYETVKESNLYVNPGVMDRYGLTLPQEYAERAREVGTQE